MNEVYRTRFSKGVTNEQSEPGLFLATLKTENMLGESAMRLDVQETLLGRTFPNGELFRAFEAPQPLDNESHPPGWLGIPRPVGKNRSTWTSYGHQKKGITTDP